MTVQEIIKKHLEQAKSQIQANMTNKGRNASKRTFNSLEVEVGDVHSSISALESIVYMERGRAKGDIPKGFSYIIAEWILKKGITVTPIRYVRAGKHKLTPEQRGLYSMANAIAYSIAKKGTRLHRSGKKEDIYTSAVELAVKNIGNEILDQAGLEVERINKDSNNG